MLEQHNLKVYLDKLASADPTPGGGSAAAVVGAMAAALLSMACNLTVNKKAYAAVEKEMRQTLARAEELRATLQDMVQADIDVFDLVMSAYHLPRESEQDTLARSEAIQTALKAATMVPLACARACAEIIDLAGVVAKKGNQNVISDAGVAAVTAHAALRSAALNVYINTGSIKDEGFAGEQLAALDDIIERAGGKNESVYADVVRALQ